MLLIVIMTLVSLAALAAAQTDPPPSGDWVVTDTTVWDEDLRLDGNLTVTSGGHLILRNMTLTMDGSHDGALTIRVEDGTSIELVNVSVLSSDPDAHYWFEARGKAVIIGSDLRDLASNNYHWYDLANILGGVQIYDGSSILLNSSFHDSQRINVYVEACAPRIEGCSFYNAEYYSSYSNYGYSYNLGGYYNTYHTDATGLYLNGADPNITECTFQDNGARGSALPYYNATYLNNGVSTFGRGVMAYQSAPNISRCQFKWNGEQPADRTVSGVRQVFFDHISYFDAYEGGLVCAGSGANPAVYDSDFHNNDVFGVLGMDGGYPRLLERCTVSANQYLRGSSVYSPSGGLYVEGGENSGTVRVANSTFSRNMVVANIWLEDVSLVLINYTNLDNRARHGYNIYLTDGSHRIVDSTLDGTGYARNLYIDYGRSRTRVTIEGSSLIGGEYGIYTTPYNGAYIWMANSTITGMGTATAFLTATNLDCLDCVLVPEKFECYAYSVKSEVRFLHLLTVDVQWQNGAGIGNASVTIRDRNGDFVYDGLSGTDGKMGPVPLVERTITMGGSQNIEESTTPFSIIAYRGGFQSAERVTPFDHSQAVDVVIYDPVLPTIQVLTPPSGHAQNTTTVRVAGMATDLGSGVLRAEITTDNATWKALDVPYWNTTVELPEGVHTIWVRVLDVAGNEVIVGIEDVVIDLTLPPIDLEEFTGTYYTNKTPCVIRGETEVGSTVLLNHRPIAEDLENGTFQLTVVLREDGAVNLTVTVVDRAGNANETQFRVVRDTVPPLIYLERPLELTNRSTVEIRGRVVDRNLAGIWLMGRPFPNDTINVSMMFFDGLVRIVVEAWDKAGNLARAMWELRVDTTHPSLSIEWPTEGLVTNSSRLEVRVTASEELAGLWIGDALVQAPDGVYRHQVNLTEGRHTLTVSGMDLAGNRVRTQVNVTLDTEPPVLWMIGPKDLTITNLADVLVEGTVEGAENVWVNRVPCLYGDTFSIVVELDETEWGQPPNFIEVLARDAAGNEARLLLRVKRDSRPPQLLVAPVDNRTRLRSVWVNGTVTDDHGVSHIEIDGDRFPLNERGHFSVWMQLQVGINVLKVVAVDMAGNEVEVTLVVEALEPREQEEPPGGPSSVLPALALLVGLAATLVLGWYLLRMRR